MESKRKKPRVLTLTLPYLNQPTLILHGKSHVLRDFSDEGFGVWVAPPLPKDLSMLTHIKGEVALDSKTYAVELELAHSSGRQLGLKIISESIELKKKLQTLLEPSVYAESLIKKELNTIEDPETGYPRLYYTGKGFSEVVIWYHPEHHFIIALQACFLGKWIYRLQRENRKMGLLADQFRGSEGMKVLNTDLITVDAKELKSLPTKASQFLTSLPYQLSGHLLWQFYETGESVFLSKELIHPLKVA